ncbi:MAG: mcbR 1 [Sedimentibacter sp.]|nr:mcbR 1 [Sedimentibacter sp.]
MEQTESLIDYAYREIKDRIQDGTYPPGTKLSTQEISDNLGISRTPVIAAINRLVAQGLAEAIPRRGTIVAQLSTQQIKDIIEVRKMIELFSIKSVIKNAEYYPEIIEKMQSLISRFNDAATSNYSNAAELENTFHTLFISLTGNAQLVKIYESNWSVGAIFYLYSLTKLPLSHHEKSFSQHRKLMQYVLEKDEENLYITMKDHLTALDNAYEWFCRKAADDLFIK